MFEATCRQCPATTYPDVTGPACCWDKYIDIILGNPWFASVSSTLFSRVASDLVDINTNFAFSDCADAQLQTFHREAVPVVLPYHGDLDKTSWWCSQAILFYYTAGCLGGANIATLQYMRSKGHADYPKGREFEAEKRVVRNLFPALLDFLNSGSNPICREQTAGVAHYIDPANPDVVDWQNSTSFLTCKKVKEPYFVSVIGEGEAQAPV